MNSRQNKQTALTIVMVVISMITLSYAAVPLYSIFCKLTGFGGTTQVAAQGSKQIGNKTITISFDSNIAPNLPWKFKPEQKKIDVVTGENALVFYEAQNLSDKAIIGTATYNVTPDDAGIYFNKIECFCFQEQLLNPKEQVSMPVSFFIDPEIENDPNLKNISHINLSYSFFRARSNEG